MPIEMANALASELAELRGIALSANGDLAVTYGADGGRARIAIWNTLLSSETNWFEAREGRAVAVRFMPDESAILGCLLSASGGASVVRWKTDAKDESEVIYREPTAAGLAMSRDSQTVAFRHAQQGLTVLDVATGITTKVIGDTHVRRVAVSPRGTRVLATQDDGVTAYRLPWTGSDVDEAAEHFRFSSLRSMDCSEATVVAASADSVEVLDGARLGIAFRTAGIRRIAVNGRGTLVAVGSEQGLSLVRLATGEVVAELSEHPPVRRLTFSLDGRFLASAHEDNVARLWDLSDQPSEDLGEWRPAVVREHAARAQVMNRSAAAAGLYRQAVDAGDSQSVRDLGRVLARAGDPGAATELYSRSLRDDDLSALRDLGHLVEDDGHLDKADDLYQQAVAAGYLGAARDLARTAAKDGRHEQAADWLGSWERFRYDQLSGPARAALGRAEGLRVAQGRSKIHMEHLILGLSQAEGGPLQQLLDKAGLGPAELEHTLAEYSGRPLDASAVHVVSLSTIPGVSAHVGDAIDVAAELAGDDGVAQVQSSDLLRGALNITDCGMVRDLISGGLHPWEVIPSEEGEPPDENAALGQLIAGTTADTVPEPGEGRVREADRLGIAADVDMLAHVLLAVDTPPPLAVGLFGSWGSGKSFYMALLQERIEELAADARFWPEAPPFCQKVLQVRFNAWHYVDTDLWASLATTLFDAWARFDDPGDARELQDKLKKLADERRLADEARRQLEHLEDEIRELREQTGELAASTQAEAEKQAEADHDPEAARASDVVERVVRAADAVAETAATMEEAFTLWQLFKEEVLARHRRETFLTLGVLVAIAVVLSVTASWNGGLKVLTLIGSVAVGLSPAFAIAVRLARQHRVERLEAQARNQRELAARRTQLARACQRLAGVQSRQDRREREVAHLEEGLAELRDRGLHLRNIVRARVASPVYREKLGVISQVRSDFEELVSLMPASHAPRQAAPVDTDPTLGEQVPRVDRIVLYIDDLDRCPADKVVEVLQAVHLLLAFKLFIVVVGVDSRWLEESLRVRYSTLLEEPQDYLEKIFQIPFRLRDMSASAFHNLIGSLTEPAEPTMPAQDAVEPAQEPEPGATRSPQDDHSSPAMNTVTGEQSAPDRPGPRANANATAETTAGTPEDHLPLSGGSGGLTSGHSGLLRPRPELLRISPPEREILAQLGVIVRTPRAAKRLVNIYRMLRVSVPPDEMDLFLPGSDGNEYKAAALLLGILVGRPHQAHELFEKLRYADEGSSIWVLLGDHLGASELRSAVGDDVQLAAYRRWADRVSRFSFLLASSRSEFIQEGIRAR